VHSSEKVAALEEEVEEAAPPSPLPSKIDIRQVMNAVDRRVGYVSFGIGYKRMPDSNIKKERCTNQAIVQSSRPPLIT
jgi:hypothetical protein